VAKLVRLQGHRSRRIALAIRGPLEEEPLRLFSRILASATDSPIACNLGKKRLNALWAVSFCRGYTLWAIPPAVTRHFTIAIIWSGAPKYRFKLPHDEVRLTVREIIKQVCSEMGVTIINSDPANRVNG
jgi:hypothetical protein